MAGISRTFDDYGNVIKAYKNLYRAAKAEYKYEIPVVHKKADMAPKARKPEYRTPGPGVVVPIKNWDSGVVIRPGVLYPGGTQEADLNSALQRLYPRPFAEKSDGKKKNKKKN